MFLSNFLSKIYRLILKKIMLQILGFGKGLLASQQDYIEQMGERPQDSGFRPKTWVLT